jgi:hypothetical protein
MTKYYKLTYSAAVAEIGDYPQVQIRWPWTSDYWGKESYTNTAHSGRIEYDIVFPEMYLAPRGKITDMPAIIGLDMLFLVVSTRFLALLQQFHMDEYQCFSRPIALQDGSETFHILFFPWPREDEYIDWSNSSFWQQVDGGEQKIVRFENAVAWMYARKQTPKEIKTHEERFQYDIFRFMYYQRGFYVSEALKQAIEAARLTGMWFEDPEWEQSKIL